MANHSIWRCRLFARALAGQPSQNCWQSQNIEITRITVLALGWGPTSSKLAYFTKGIVKNLYIHKLSLLQGAVGRANNYKTRPQYKSDSLSQDSELIHKPSTLNLNRTPQPEHKAPSRGSLKKRWPKATFNSIQDKAQIKIKM